MPPSQRQRTLSVTTPLSEDLLLLRRMSASEHLSRPFEYELELVSERIDISPGELLGQSVTVALVLPDDRRRFFNGAVSHFSHVGFDGANALYRCTLVPWVWFLSRTADCRIYQDRTVPDIVKAIFREHGFTDFEERLSGTYHPWGYRVQYRETDLSFVSRLLEHEGIYYFFEHQDGKHSLVLADSYGAHAPIPGYQKVPYYPPDATALQSREHISDWSIGQQVRSGAFAHTSFDFTAPRKDLRARRDDPKPHGRGDFEVFDYQGDYTEHADGDSYARLRLEEIQADQELAQATGNARGLTTGALFTLTGYRREDQNREYLIVSTHCLLQSDLFGSGESAPAPPVFGCTLTAIDAQVPYRPPRETPKPFVQGPQTAVVTGKAGEEIWTDRHGRVKVQFHWDRYGKRDENSSCWVRVSHPWAGKGWGAVAIPRIGQEVIVDFLEGDPDQPIITGRVYNGANMPPYPLPGSAVVSGMKSNSHKAGGFNEISADDTAGKEKITVHAQYDMNTAVNHDQTDVVHNNRSATVDVNDSEHVGSNQTVTIGANQTLTVGGKQTVSVGGTRSLTVGGAESTKIAATRLLTIGGSATTVIGASRSLSVSAGNTEAIGGARKTTVGSADALTVTASRTVAIGAALSVTAGSSITLTVGGSTIKIAPGGIEISSPKVTITGAGGVTITGAIVKVNS